MPGHARVKLQIEVGPLTVLQLEAELEQMGHAKPEAIPLLQAIRKEPLMRKITETPFYFNTLQLLFAGSLPTFTSNKLKGRRTEIIQKFIEYELTNTKNREYPSDQIVHWLAFLAFQMKRYNIVVFELNHLQYSWWSNWGRSIKLIAWLVDVLIELMVVWIVIIPFFGLFSGFALWLTLGLFVGVVLGHKKLPIIITRDAPKWTIRNYLKCTKPILTFSLVLGVFFGLLGWLALSLGFTTGPQGNLQLGKIGLFLACLLAGLLAGLFAGALFGFMEMANMNFSLFLQINSPYQRFYGSIKSLYFSVLQHGLLRYQLYKKGALPLDLVRFLNEMVNRNLLETDGATWRFRHKIIQDYFVKQWVKPQK